MKLKYTFLFLAALVTVSTLSAQKIKVKSGKVKDLQGVERLQIAYDYSDLGVGKFEHEEDYIAKKVTELNEDEAGRGDAWKKAWFNDRPTRFEPKFEELFTKYAPFIEADQNLEAEITMRVYTTFIEPGYNVMVSRKPASINLEIDFEKAGEVFLEVLILSAPGGGAGGYDLDVGYRVQEAYAKAAKSFGKYLDKQLN